VEYQVTVDVYEKSCVFATRRRKGRRGLSSSRGAQVHVDAIFCSPPALKSTQRRAPKSKHRLGGLNLAKVVRAFFGSEFSRNFHAGQGLAWSLATKVFLVWGPAIIAVLLFLLGCVSPVHVRSTAGLGGNGTKPGVLAFCGENDEAAGQR